MPVHAVVRTGSASHHKPLASVLRLALSTRVHGANQSSSAGRLRPETLRLLDTAPVHRLILSRLLICALAANSAGGGGKTLRSCRLEVRFSPEGAARSCRRILLGERFAHKLTALATLPMQKRPSAIFSQMHPTRRTRVRDDAWIARAHFGDQIKLRDTSFRAIGLLHIPGAPYEVALSFPRSRPFHRTRGLQPLARPSRSPRDPSLHRPGLRLLRLQESPARPCTPPTARLESQRDRLHLLDRHRRPRHLRRALRRLARKSRPPPRHVLRRHLLQRRLLDRLPRRLNAPARALYLGYGVVGGVGLGLGYISPVSTLIKWFPTAPASPPASPSWASAAAP